MRLTFGLTFDTGVWPGPLGADRVAFDVAWVGPLGLVARLETQLGVGLGLGLGLGGPGVSATMRAERLAASLRDTDGFWSASARVDPLGTARELLRLRDRLYLYGWRGDPVMPRLAALAKATSPAGPGLVDRIRTVIDALETQPIDIERVRHAGGDRARLPRLWRDLLDALDRRGVTIEALPPDSAHAGGDLGACFATDFAPAGDGTLQLIRPAGALAAAEQVAEWLATQERLDDIVIIGADPVLDIALARRGVPVIGSRPPTGAGAALQLLPLVVDLAWLPQDPHLALDLVTIRPCPVPSPVARRLFDALMSAPAVDSDEWRRALAKGLADIEDDDRRARADARLRTILTGTVAGTEYPIDELRSRIDALRSWLQANLGMPDADADRWAPAVAQTSNLLDLIDAGTATTYTRPELSRLIESATADAPTPSYLPAEAGVHAVGAPASIVGPARAVIWWNFTRGSVETIRSDPFGQGELDALRAAGVDLPELAARATDLTDTWRQPFAHAESQILLVCPRVGDDGRALLPHPVMDEIFAHLGDDAIALIERPEPTDAARTRSMEPFPLPEPRTSWTIPAGSATTPEHIWPTSAGALIGCPLHFVLAKIACLKRGRTQLLPDGPLVYGNLSHAALEHVLLRIKDGETLTPDDAARESGTYFDTEGPRMAAALYMNGSEILCADVRQCVVDAAREFVRHLQDSGATIAGVEEWLDRKPLGTTEVGGRCDVRLSNPNAIVDFKWGGANSNREALRFGAAYQLAVYAHLAAGDGPMPPAAYFIVRDQIMLASSSTVFPDAEDVGGFTLARVWKEFQRGCIAGLEEIAAGRVACGCCVDGEEQPSRDELTDDGLVLAPPCRYCEFQMMCNGAPP